MGPGSIVVGEGSRDVEIEPDDFDAVVRADQRVDSTTRTRVPASISTRRGSAPATASVLVSKSAASWSRRRGSSYSRKSVAYGRPSLLRSSGRRLSRSSKKVCRKRTRRSGISAELLRELPGAVFDSFAEVWFDLGPVADDAGIDSVGALLGRHLVHLGGSDDFARFGHDADPTAARRGLEGDVRLRSTAMSSAVGGRRSEPVPTGARPRRSHDGW